jgi:nuclear pore complex protein Nup54
MQTVIQKWDTSDPNCVFRTYFYNKADDTVPFYHPGPQDDPKEWEEALSKKPGPGLVPTLCVGFLQMGERIKLQQNTLTAYNMRLHEINRSLSFLLENHDAKTSIRAMDARRKHAVLKQRCLALASKVQILRNKGFTLTGDEEDLKVKLMALDKGVSDPGLGARAEEIWARMITVQERARLLRAEIEKSGVEQTKVLDEEIEAKAKKVRSIMTMILQNPNIWLFSRW